MMLKSALDKYCEVEIIGKEGREALCFVRAAFGFCCVRQMVFSYKA